ncbi:MAG: hypothetical protein UZ21_OP11001000034 [Microgenomates bacterium OLB22]|nr:MAG: hypothetical protein UZ21_OP11001000034 [Microgenomates bacterium OLB22]
MLDYLYWTQIEATMVLSMIIGSLGTILGVVILRSVFSHSRVGDWQEDKIKGDGWFGLGLLVFGIFTGLVSPWPAVLLFVCMILWAIGGAFIESLKGAPLFFQGSGEVFSLSYFLKILLVIRLNSNFSLLPKQEKQRCAELWPFWLCS